MLAPFVTTTGDENATLKIIFLLLFSGVDFDNTPERGKLNVHLALRNFLEEVDFRWALEKVSETG